MSEQTIRYPKPKIAGGAEKVIKEKLNVGMYEGFIDKVIADSEMNICGMENFNTGL